MAAPDAAAANRAPGSVPHTAAPASSKPEPADPAPTTTGRPARTPRRRIDPARKLERALVTPEGVDLRLRLADAGERGAAFILDALFIALALFAVSLLALVTAVETRLEGVDMVAVVWLLAFFFLRNFYFIAFELGPRAATPGKRLLGIRVGSRDGGRLTANAIFARNAMREVEVFLPLSFLAANAGDIDALIVLAGFIWSAIFLFFPLFNRDRLRAGDLIGGTWVVKAPKRALDRDLTADAGATEAALAFTTEQLDAYGVH